MASVFTEIISGDEPARFVWRDDRCVAFMDAAPLTPGHVLVVPIEEIDRWTDAPGDLMAHLWEVTGIIGKAQFEAFPCERIGVMVAGYEVPHLHIHSFPTTSIIDFDLRRKNPRPDPAELERQAVALRAALADAGYATQVRGLG